MRRRRAVRGDRVGRAARRLADAQAGEGEQQPGNRGEVERRAPALERHHDRPHGEVGDQQADRQPEHEQADRARAPRRGKQVADQRVRRRRVARFADADHRAQPQEGDEGAGQPGEPGEQAPHREPQRQHHAARSVVDPASQRQSGHRVHQHETGGNQPQLEVVEAPLAPDRLGHHRRQRAVEEVEQVGREQQREHAPGVGGLRAGSHATGSCGGRGCGSQRAGPVLVA